MAEMSREDFMRLQRDAEARMKEMQRRSEEMVGRQMPPTPDFVKVRRSNETVKQPHPPATVAPPVQKNEVRRSGGFDLLRMLNFKNISMDSDRSLIIAVMLLLMGETGDELLLLALIYIML